MEFDSPREKCPYSGLFWSVFSRIRTEYGEIPSPNTGKYGAEQLRIRALVELTLWENISSVETAVRRCSSK